jgi:hypothetical protein
VYREFGVVLDLPTFEARNAVIGYFCSIVDVLLYLEEANALVWFHERLACTDTTL